MGRNYRYLILFRFFCLSGAMLIKLTTAMMRGLLYMVHPIPGHARPAGLLPGASVNVMDITITMDRESATPMPQVTETGTYSSLHRLHCSALPSAYIYAPLICSVCPGAT